MESVLIAGGSGLVGSRLRQLLIARGYSVKKLTRNRKSNSDILWNPDLGSIDLYHTNQFDYVVNLAGENVSNKRWSKRQKEKILQSRINSSELLVKSISQLKKKPKAIIASSAVGYYGYDDEQKIFSENDKNADDFLGGVCLEWENKNSEAKQFEIRTAILRTGVVLAENGGAYPKLNRLAKRGLASPLGSGKQYMPWIHIDDLCEMYIFAIQNNSVSGVYNAVAPEHVDNSTFTKLMSKMNGRNVWLPKVPKAILKLLFGQMSDILLKGNRVECEKIQKAGFIFKFPSLLSAIKELHRK